MLINTRHEDEVTAALSIAANRASKCQLLRRQGYPGIADRYARNLFFDVRQWIGETVAGNNASDQTCERLHEIVASAR